MNLYNKNAKNKTTRRKNLKSYDEEEDFKKEVRLDYVKVEVRIKIVFLT